MAQNRRYQYFATFGVSLLAMTTAVVLFWSSPVLPKFINNETSIHLTSSEVSWVVACISPGSIAGSLAASKVSDKFGRRTTILTSVIPYIAGTIFILAASQAWMLYVGRFFWGCGSGMTATVSAMYLSEVIDKEVRGTLTVGTRIVFNFGATLVLIVGAYVSYNGINYMMFGMIALYFIVCWFIPETPYFYLKEGKVDKARKEIIKLSGLKNGKEVDERLTAMRADVRRDMMRSSSVKELLTGKQYRRAIIVCIGLRITQVMAGSIPIQQYLGAIIMEAKIGIEVSNALVIFGVARFLVGFLSTALIDKLGRRPLLMFSYIGASIILAINGTYFFYKDAINENEALGPYRIIVYVLMVLCKVVGNLGFDVLIFVVPGEIFPLNVRATAMGAFNIFSAFVTFAAVRGYQVKKDLMGLHGVFWFYSIMAFSGAIFTYFLVPETKGKSLNEIQVELQGQYYNDGITKLNGVAENDALPTNNEVATELKEIRGETEELLNR